jgi:rubrerythrin
MSAITDTAGLEAALDSYVRRWAPVQWRGDLESVVVDANPAMGLMLAYLGAIETDSRMIARKVRLARVDADEVLHEFLIVWQAEESEHGRLLAGLAKLYGTQETARRTRLTLAEWVIARLCGLLVPKSFRALYCTLGSIQEFMALRTYQHVARHCGNATVAGVLRSIAVQESRHMRFYSEGARHYLSGHPMRQRFVRCVLRRFWAPPGQDLLGKDRYAQIFGPLISQWDFYEEARSVETVYTRLPGMRPLGILDRWMRVAGIQVLQPTSLGKQRHN